MTRRFLALLAVGLMVVVAFGAQPADALPGLPNPCDLAPSGPLADACNAAQGVTNPVAAIGGITGLAGDVTGIAGVDLPGPAYLDDALNWMVGLFAGTVQQAMTGLGQMLDAAPAPPIDQTWFDLEYKPLMRAGVALLFLVAIIYFPWYGLRGRITDLGHAFQMFLVALMAIVLAPLFVRLALQMADGLSAAFAGWGGAEAGQLTDKVTEVTSHLTVGDGIMAAIGPILLLILLFFSVCMVLVWMVLLTVRAELIYVGTLAIPFVLPSIVGGSATFARVYFKALFGLIITKPILIGTLVTGAWLMKRGALGADGIQALVAGFSIFLVATVGCFFLFKLLGVATPVVVAVERGGRRAVSTVRTATVAAAGLVTGGAAGVAMASTATSSPRSAPPRPRGGS